MMLTLATVASHDQESHAVSDVYCLDPRNAVVPLVMLLALCDAGANGFTSLKETCYLSFQLSLPKDNNGAIYDAVGTM